MIKKIHSEGFQIEKKSNNYVIMVRTDKKTNLQFFVSL